MYVDGDRYHLPVLLIQRNNLDGYPVYLWMICQGSTIFGVYCPVMLNVNRFLAVSLIVISCCLPMTVRSQAMPVIPEPVMAPSWKPIPMDHIQLMSWLQTEVDQVVSVMLQDKDALAKSLDALERFGASNAPNLNPDIDLQQMTTALSWLNGLVDLAILTGKPELKSIVITAMDQLKGMQEPSGYLGIFPSDHWNSLKRTNDNLCTKAQVLIALLTWYDHTQDASLLKCVEQAAQEAYSHFPYRQMVKPDPAHQALTNGLTMIDVLANLYFITGQVVYKEFIIDLLHAARYHPGSILSEFDDPSGLEQITSEHCATLRWLAIARSMTSEPYYQDVFQKGLAVIQDHTGPTGALLEPRSIKNFISTQELLNTWSALLMITGDPKYAEWIENLTLNTFASNQLPDGKGLFQYTVDDDKLPPQEQRYFTSIKGSETSPVLASWTHIYPDHIRSLWFKDDQGFICASFAPCEMQSTWGNRHVRIQESLGYPGDYQLRLNVQTDSICTFMVKVRKPKWARAITVNQPYSIVGDFIYIEIEWSGFDEINIVFVPGISSHRTKDGERWFSFGPLVLAHPVPAIEILKEGEVAEVRRFKSDSNVRYRIKSTDKPKRPHGSDSGDLRFSFPALRSDNNEEETIRMVPIRNTILSQTTFPEYKP